MPAAAVIPAPRAYINVVAVKTLVVKSWGRVELCPSEDEYGFSLPVSVDRVAGALTGFPFRGRATKPEVRRRWWGRAKALCHIVRQAILRLIYFEKNRVLKAGLTAIE